MITPPQTRYLGSRSGGSAGKSLEVAAEAERGAENCGRKAAGGQQERGTKLRVFAPCRGMRRGKLAGAHMRAAPRQPASHPAGRRGAGAQLAAATRASCSWRVQVGFCGSSTAWPPAASILALAEALKAAALMVSGACSSPVPSTCRGGPGWKRSWVAWGGVGARDQASGGIVKRMAE